MATAALAVLGEAVQRCTAQLEPYADRLLPKVAWRLVDAKAGIREAAQEVLAGAHGPYIAVQQYGAFPLFSIQLSATLLSQADSPICCSAAYGPDDHGEKEHVLRGRVLT